MRYLIINTDGLIVNVIIWDGISPYTPDNGSTLLPTDQAPQGAGVGWAFINGECKPLEELPDTV